MALLSVVIPVYKAEDCLEELYRRLRDACAQVSDDFEIVLVEDYGADRSWDIITELARHDGRVRGIQFSRNFGQHYAIAAGLDACDGDWVVVMDCDLQDRPEEIPRLYAKAQEGYDVVLARRGLRKDSWPKRITSAVFYWIFQYLTDIPYDGEVGNFRIISRQVVDVLRSFRERLRFFGGLMTWIGFRTASIDVEHAQRFAGKSTYSYRRLARLATETILAYSDKPLRLTIGFGFFIAGSAFVIGVYYVIHALKHQITVSGWASLIVSLYFMSGIVIALLGVIGLYVGKMFDETKRRPLYIVMRRTETSA